MTLLQQGREQVSAMPIKKIVLSILFGWIAVLGAQIPLHLDNIYGIQFDWAMLFPIFIAHVFGKRYALISLTLGGSVAVPFLLTPQYGNTNFVSALFYSALILIVAIVGPRNQGKKIYGVLFLFGMCYFGVMYYATPALLETNTVGTRYLSLVILQVQLLSFIFQCFVLVVLAKILCFIPLVRQWVDLPVIPYAKNNTAVLSKCLLIFGGFVVLDSWIEQFYFDSRGQHLSVFSSSGNNIAKLLMVMALALFLFDLTLSNAMKHEKARMQLQDSRAQIIELNKGLETLVEERTKELKLAYQALQSFSYDVTHEFKSPIRELETYVTIIQEDNADRLDEQTRVDLASMKHICDRTIEMIDNMILYAKTGYMELHVEKIDLKYLAIECVNELKQAFKVDDIQLKTYPQPLLEADRFLIKTALMNIFSNSIKFSAKNQTILLTCGAMAHEEKVIYYFKDNGIGFNMDDATDVFELFHRSHQSETFDGNGIGLTLVKRIVERCGGEVHLLSAENKGCIVFLVFNQS